MNINDAELARAVSYGWCLSDEAVGEAVERGLAIRLPKEPVPPQLVLTDAGKDVLLHVKLETECLGNLTLGLLATALRRYKRDATVHFDWPEMLPTVFASYRGCYDQVALGFERHHYHQPANATRKYDWPTVAALLKETEAATGSVYSGWKGGEYVMTETTAIWVANPGDASGLALVGIDGEPDDPCPTLRTQWAQ